MTDILRLNEFYQTQIICSTYNANIDSTDNVVTVKLIKFDGNPVVGKSVTLTCDKGYFNKKGSTAISGTSTKSITLTTDSNGEISGTWTASEWGLCTFSANNISSQINVTGWKTNYDDANYTVRYNDRFVEVSVHIPSINFPASWSEWADILSGPANLRPLMPVLFWDMTGKVQVRVTNTSYKIAFHSASNVQISQSCYAMVCYSRQGE